MKKSLVLAMAMALGVTASAYAANPFSDVPAGHWAYDSVNKLAAAGIVDGYGNGTFGGDRLMTRYEMAQIVGERNPYHSHYRLPQRVFPDEYGHNAAPPHGRENMYTSVCRITKSS